MRVCECGPPFIAQRNGTCGVCAGSMPQHPPGETEEKTIATLIEDRNVVGQYRVEAEDDDGGMEVAIFAGPGALERAIFFASEYYDGWNDPQGLAGY